MSNDKRDLVSVMKRHLKQCQNPADLKPVIVGKVEKLDPIIVSTHEGKALWVEHEELFISEWFKFRCNIDKTKSLSESVPSELSSAKQINEVHSYTGTGCQMPDSITHLASAINYIDGELLSLKCELKVGDLVILGSLEQTDRYILLDKVL